MKYVLCTLLGPEGPGRCIPVFLSRSVGCGWTGSSGSWSHSHECLVVGCVGGGGYRPYFENYTVDASIYTLASMIIQAFGSGCDSV